MNLAVFAFSRRGCETALRVRAAIVREGDECRLYTMPKFAGGDFLAFDPPCSRAVGPVFAWADAMVFVGAIGIAVRSIAPHVRDKRTDPAVVCVDERGAFAVALLSGHIGGANALTQTLAEAIGAVPVITTATDLNGRFSVDAWAAREGLAIADMRAAKAVSAEILERDVPLCCDFPIETALPAGVVAGDAGGIGICISCFRKAPFSQTLLLVPRILHLGIGCRRGVPEERIRAAVDAVLREHCIDRRAIRSAASIDRKADEAGLLAYCEREGLPVAFYPAETLRAVAGDFTPSARVQRVTGVDNVCERAAMVGAERLLVRKTARDGVTVAVAQERWAARF